MPITKKDLLKIKYFKSHLYVEGSEFMELFTKLFKIYTADFAAIACALMDTSIEML